jgi:deazaflavin-dependent oxidoreductase (nitroreductase family)
MAHAQPTRPTHAPRIVTFMNPLVNRLARAGLRLGPNVLLTVRGRSSGLPRTFPVALMEADGRLYVQSPYGEVNWVRNLRANERAVLARNGKSEDVEAVEVAPEAAEPILRAVLAPYRRHRLTSAVARVFIPVDADASSDEYIAHARRHPMFELRVAPASDPSDGSTAAPPRPPES